jgi:hypothetical protein
MLGIGTLANAMQAVVTQIIQDHVGIACKLKVTLGNIRVGGRP